MIKSRKDRSVITDCSKNAFHIDDRLVLLAYLLRNILMAKFQSEQSLLSTPEKFWIISLVNLPSIFHALPLLHSVHMIQLLGLPGCVPPGQSSAIAKALGISALPTFGMVHTDKCSKNVYTLLLRIYIWLRIIQFSKGRWFDYVI